MLNSFTQEKGKISKVIIIKFFQFLSLINYGIIFFQALYLSFQGTGMMLLHMIGFVNMYLLTSVIYSVKCEVILFYWWVIACEVARSKSQQ